jgi:hypothetical protein
MGDSFILILQDRYLTLFHRAEISTMDVERTLHRGELSHGSQNNMVYHDTGLRTNIVLLIRNTAVAGGKDQQHNKSDQ